VVVVHSDGGRNGSKRVVDESWVLRGGLVGSGVRRCGCSRWGGVWVVFGGATHSGGATGRLLGGPDSETTHNT
jgi:hypothetical protein